MNDPPKRVKRQLRELAATAHERAVRVHLETLAEDFARWRDGALDTWELTDRIHRFHDGPNRDLFVQYTGSRPDMVVAHAVVTGLLKETEVPVEVFQVIAGAIAFYRSIEGSPERPPEGPA
jgi:hypothetical protein